MSPERGDRVRLVRCTDQYTRLEPGALGTVSFVDSLGTVHVDWDSGAQLGLVPGEDVWMRVDEEEPNRGAVIQIGLEFPAVRVALAALAEAYGEELKLKAIGPNDLGFVLLALDVPSGRVWFVTAEGRVEEAPPEVAATIREENPTC